MKGLVHMAFEITNDFTPVEFDIPAGKDKKVTLSVPPMDCISPSDVDAMNKQLEAFEDADVEDARNPLKDAAALLRFQLKYFNPGKQKADLIDGLVVRQLRQIDKHWAEASQIDMGESETSTDDSSETEQ